MNSFSRRVREVLKSYGLVAWRVMGSPRIPWIERTLQSLTGISVTVELPASRNARIAGVAVAGVMMATMLTWAGVAVARGGNDAPAAAAEPTATPVVTYLTEVDALGAALAAARDNGLDGNFAHVARRVTLFEYAQAVGEAYRAQQGFLEAPPETEVWAIAFAGTVEAELSTGDSVEFNNITVVVDALTRQVYRVEAFYGDYESPARAPVWLRPPPTEGPQ